MTLPEYAWRMLEDLGVRECSGDEHNPRILEYIDSTPLGRWARQDETAWCGAFQSFACAQAGYYPPKDAHRARAWTQWGRKAGPDEIVGAVCVLQLKKRTKRQRRATGSARGGYHVGTVLGVYRGGVVLISGNKDDEVGVDPYPFSRWRLVAYRVPR